MIIENKDYILEQISKDSHFFDLTFPKVINKGKDNERKEMKLEAYGMPFDSCIKKIVDFRFRNLEGEFTLEEAIEKYSEFVSDIEEEIGSYVDS